ncbi:hypothetical protein LINGRAHAP2_LOCUS15043 [Linum grandiflorum]
MRPYNPPSLNLSSSSISSNLPTSSSPTTISGPPSRFYHHLRTHGDGGAEAAASLFSFVRQNAASVGGRRRLLSSRPRWLTAVTTSHASSSSLSLRCWLLLRGWWGEGWRQNRGEVGDSGGGMMMRSGGPSEMEGCGSVEDRGSIHLVVCIFF